AESFIQPFGTLWFIYILPIFFIVTRLVRNAPVWLVLALAALLQLLPIHTGWVAVDEFASRFVFFYAGYALAHHAFAIADYARTHRSEMLLGLTIWLIIQTLYVYTSLAWQPGFALLLGAFGAAAVVTLSSLIADKKWAQVISYCGQNSLVIYLAFFLPMALSRVVLLKFGIISDVGTIAALVTTTAIICPLIGYWVIRRIGFGGFLFNRPFWARLTAAEKPAVHSIAA
ncbi:MAG: acyltransferase family protein, partial [Pseudomonadota bacterium]